MKNMSATEYNCAFRLLSTSIGNFKYSHNFYAENKKKMYGKKHTEKRCTTEGNTVTFYQNYCQ